ncbi:PadR family transcriptional regulator [Halosimplex pelagicum]|uniref:Helix-turn-helix transcriptional regulator n=1 Tax=Halosimplex pelagicum TaxID=869886 RepID=A0A7D5P6Z9_9EURY|nr:PadR family transcriptional regulator [Halosimplex pelagicum]QLH82397.1 helix-turn-helix transcriptional regulator [Halosimplex pelagicum]
MQELSAFQRDLLHVLAGLNEPHGLAIKEELEDYYDGEVNHGRLYPNLDKLDEFGLIEKDKFDDRTNIYEITDEGEQVLDQRAAWEKQYYRPTPQRAAATQGD